MRLTFCLCMILICFFNGVVFAACNPDMPASTPNSQLLDNGDGTVTDSATGLMWKQCLEGLSGSLCATGSALTFTWQQALERPGVVNGSGGVAGHSDWRLPNIKELRSIVEEQCWDPAINEDRFPGIYDGGVWSASPHAGDSGFAWYIGLSSGVSSSSNRDYSFNVVRLVRGGQ